MTHGARSLVAAAVWLAFLAGGCSDVVLGDVRRCGDGGCAGQDGRQPGPTLGELVAGYYWAPFESDYSGTADTALPDGSCAPLATVPALFAADACLLGTGRLRDGRIVNHGPPCSCGLACGDLASVCFAFMDPTVFPWGAGNQDNALEPVRSWAVDGSIIPFGSIVYVPAWDGAPIPAVAGAGGFVHDGCFRADSVFGVSGARFAIFAGPRDLERHLQTVIPAGTAVPVHQSAPHCEHLRR